MYFYKCMCNIRLPKYSSSYHELDAKRLSTQKANNNALKRQKDNMGNSIPINNHNYNRPHFGPGTVVPRGAPAPFGQRNPEYRIPPRGNFQRGGYHPHRGSGPANGYNNNNNSNGGGPNHRGNNNSRGGPPIPSSDRGGYRERGSSGSHGYPPPPGGSSGNNSRSSSSASSSRYDGVNRENGSGNPSSTNSKDTNSLLPPVIAGEKKKKNDKNGK